MKMPRATVGNPLFAGPARPALAVISEPMPGKRVSGGRRRALLCSTALIGLFIALPGTKLVLAQQVIDGGQTVTVPSGAQPSPWNVGTDLYIGSTGNGALHIVSGGNVSNINGNVGVNTGSKQLSD